MVLRAAKVIFLAAFCTMLHSAQCDGSDEYDETLREVLLLIQLIRRAGVSDASHEKHSLSKHGAIPAPMKPDPPQPLHNVSPYNNTYLPDTDRRNQTEDKHLQANYRRSMTGDSKPIIMIETNDKTSISSTKTTLETTSASTNKPQIGVKKNEPNTNIIKPAGNSHKINVRRDNWRNVLRNGTKENFQKKTKTKSGAEIDPVMSQVQSELKNEMNSVGRNQNKSERQTHTEMYYDLKSRETKPQPTLRVHLKGSSNYPIPFPENHALCYTDPMNGLCRTPI